MYFRGGTEGSKIHFSFSYFRIPGGEKTMRGGGLFLRLPPPPRLDTFSLLSLFLGKFGKQRGPGSLIHFTWLLFNVSQES